MHVRAKKVFPQSACPGRRLRCADVTPPSRGAGGRLAKARKSQKPRDLRCTPHVYSTTTTTVQPKRPSPESPFNGIVFFFFLSLFLFFSQCFVVPYIYDQRLRSEAMAGRRVTPETDNDEKGARARGWRTTSDEERFRSFFALLFFFSFRGGDDDDDDR